MYFLKKPTQRYWKMRNSWGRCFCQYDEGLDPNLVTDMNQGKMEKVTGRMETEYPKAPESDKSFIQLFN